MCAFLEAIWIAAAMMNLRNCTPKAHICIPLMYMKLSGNSVFKLYCKN